MFLHILGKPLWSKVDAISIAWSLSMAMFVSTSHAADYSRSVIKRDNAYIDAREAERLANAESFDKQIANENQRRLNLLHAHVAARYSVEVLAAQRRSCRRAVSVASAFRCYSDSSEYSRWALKISRLLREATAEADGRRPWVVKALSQADSSLDRGMQAEGIATQVTAFLRSGFSNANASGDFCKQLERAADYAVVNSMSVVKAAKERPTLFLFDQEIARLDALVALSGLAEEQCGRAADLEKLTTKVLVDPWLAKNASSNERRSAAAIQCARIAIDKRPPELMNCSFSAVNEDLAATIHMLSSEP